MNKGPFGYCGATVAHGVDGFSTLAPHRFIDQHLIQCL
jgi:hypothetical protein